MTFWQPLLALLLLCAVMLLVGLLLWVGYPEWPNFSYPVFAFIYGVLPGLAVCILWNKAVTKAIDKKNVGDELFLYRSAMLFVAVTVGATYQASQGKWPFEPDEPAQAVAPAAATTPAQAPVNMSPSERQLHARAVMGLKEEAAAWMKRLEDSGAHGPAGTAPEFLEVETLAGRIRVENRGTEPARVALSRSLASPPSPDAEVCQYRSERGPAYLDIPAGGSGDFVPTPACREAKGALEFRVGDPALGDPLGWWSDPAITRWRAANGGVPVER